MRLLLISMLFLTGCGGRQLAPFGTNDYSVAIELGDKPTITFKTERRHDYHTGRNAGTIRPALHRGDLSLGGHVLVEEERQERCESGEEGHAGFGY